eukprot:727894-Amorphochlora_amoeboformis.AAC.1
MAASTEHGERGRPQAEWLASLYENIRENIGSIENDVLHGKYPTFHLDQFKGLMQKCLRGRERDIAGFASDSDIAIHRFTGAQKISNSVLVSVLCPTRRLQAVGHPPILPRTCTPDGTHPFVLLEIPHSNLFRVVAITSSYSKF